MTRRIRAFSRPRPTSVETLQTCFQHRPLLRAGPRLNARVIGVLAKAQALYGVEIHGFVVLSNHLHLNATYGDPKQMADLHCFLCANLAKEAGRLRDWQGCMFPERYRHVEISPEPEAEWARMKYLLSQGCKEGLVASPLDWPGASSTWALVSGEPLIGAWVDRTALRRARERGEEVSEAAFTETLEVKLSPIPSLAHLSAEQYRQEMRVLVRQIEEETAARHRVEGTRPVGAARVSAVDPHDRPAEIPRRPGPWCHAWDPEVRASMRRALTTIYAYYRAAAQELKAGNRQARFPVHTFPPGLPFVKESAGSLELDRKRQHGRKRPAPSLESEPLDPG